MVLSKITLAPASPSDYLAVARLQSAAFAKEEFGIVAFGPHRNSDAAMEAHARSLAKKPTSGQTIWNIKAVTILSDGTEEIVGFASWITCIGRGGSEEEKARLGTKEGWAQEEKEKETKKGDEEEDPFGPAGKLGNVKLREDAFVVGDKHLARATEGRDYENLTSLVVSPKYQRQGIGAMLFEEGLKRADEAGLQVVLGASLDGVGLYKRYGFVEFEVMDFKLWEYEGGAGLGVHTNVMMHRPAVSQEGSRST